MSHNDGVIQLGCLHQHREAVVPERDNGEGTIVEAF